MTTGWLWIEEYAGAARIHVRPVEDVIDHDDQHFDECVCGPDAEYVEGGGCVVTHHALDGREHLEHNHDRAACPLCSA